MKMDENRAGDIDLLEEIMERVGCFYMSDLHNPREYPMIRLAAEDLESENYSLHQWNDAVQYISGKKIYFEKTEEAKEYLVRFCNKTDTVI